MIFRIDIDLDAQPHLRSARNMAKYVTVMINELMTDLEGGRIDTFSETGSPYIAESTPDDHPEVVVTRAAVLHDVVMDNKRGDYKVLTELSTIVAINVEPKKEKPH